MSTRIGIIAEGSIDHALLPGLLERIACDRANFRWPLDAEDMAAVFRVRKRGQGGVLETVRRLVEVLDTQSFEHAFFVILLDRRTRAVQEKIRGLLKNRNRFALGVAIEEIEAWWLADRQNTLKWTELSAAPPGTRYAAEGYRAERDDDPKKTLDELTQVSLRFDRCYGAGNTDMASEFAEEYWRGCARLDDIRADCRKGYRPFERVATNRFRAAKRAAGRLL